MSSGVRKYPRCQGFSMIELLMVLLLLGMLAAVTGPGIGKFLDNLEFRKQTAKILATLRYARIKAITGGEVVMVAQSEDDPLTLSLSGGVTGTRGFGLEEDEDDSLELDPTILTFYPEGYVTPGTLVFSKGERKQTIGLDALTGLPLLDVEDND